MSLVDEARTVRDRIAARLRELEPLVREYDELMQVAAEMGLDRTPTESDSTPTDVRRAPTTSSAPRRRATARSASTVATPAVSAELTDRVLEAVRLDPGRTVAEYAELLDVAATALYRPVRKLTSEGVLVKRVRQLFPVP
jgi:hypothetical protein